MKCSTCGIEISNRTKHHMCRKCYKSNYRLVNRSDETKRTKEWHGSNPDKAKAYAKAQREKEGYRDKRKALRQSEKYKIWAAKYHRMKRNEDIGFRLSSNLRNRVRKAMLGINRSTSTLKLIGCSIEELISHIESKFIAGMSWTNYGEWHIDHIKPLNSFDLTDPVQLSAACNYRNLQPLWAEDNIRKSDT